MAEVRSASHRGMMRVPRKRKKLYRFVKLPFVRFQEERFGRLQ